MGRGALSDAEWERLRPFLPVSNRRCGRWRDHRQVIDGDVSVDSIIVRAHQHAAGARTEPPSALNSKGVEPDTPGRNAVAEPRRPPDGGGAGGEDLGRSRGGFTTKLRLSADGRCRPLSLIVTPGQRAECTQFKPVLEKIRVPKPGPSRPRKKPDSVAADKAYSNRPCREHLRRRGVRHTIPEKTDSQAARLRKGSRGGRPPGFHEERHKKRTTVERSINRLKQHRVVATRYDKRGYVLLGTVTTAALTIWLRT
ncbi:IS5 family transposase [Streptomyces sp. NPDC058751]|uniref:IS5 family transposase n=1 Tax=Streptomyces sp. NPDC058751 TaxID=3346623 RepID=UPI0036B28298